MNTVSVVGVFCEDIREEQRGLVSLIGIVPDNMNIPPPPNAESMTAIPKLHFYGRISFDPKTAPKKVASRIIMTNGDVVDLGEVSTEVIEKNAADARKQSNPLTSIVTSVSLSPFPIPKLGRVTVLVTVDGTEFTAAILNIVSVSEDKLTTAASETRLTRHTMNVSKEKGE